MNWRLLPLLLLFAWSAPLHAAPVLPPGQESLVERLLRLPAESPCRYESAQIRGDTVRARYRCPDGLHTATLVHQSQPLADSIVAGDWRIAVRSSAVRSGLESQARAQSGLVKWNDAHSQEVHSVLSSFTGQLRHGLASNAGVISVLFTLLVVVGLVYRVTLGAPVRVLWSLGAASMVAVVLRSFISPWAALGVWPFGRLQLIARQLWESTALAALLQASGTELALSDLNHAVTFAAASLTPVAVYAHGSLLFHSRTVGLIAAWLVALNPSHIRFSWSDSEMVLSLLLATLTLGVLHASQRSDRLVVRTLALFAFVGLYFLALGTREANIALAPVAIGALALQYNRARIFAPALALLAILVPSALYIHYSLLPAMREGPGSELWPTLGLLPELILSPDVFVLWNPRIYPPAYWLLAALGLVTLARAPRLGGYLVVWFAAYAGLHLLYFSSLPEMNARYQLHLLSPLVLICAAGGREILRRLPNQPILLMLGSTAALMPFWQGSFIGDVSWDDVIEYDVVHRWTRALPEGCTVVEYGGKPATASRFWRSAAVLRDGKPMRRLSVQLHREPNEGMGPEGPVEMNIVPIDAPLPTGRCVVVYVGLTCYVDAADGQAVVVGCERLLPFDKQRILASRPLVGRAYDSHHQVPHDGLLRSFLLIDRSDPPLPPLALAR